MIGATDRAFDLFGFPTQDHPAMAADVLKHAHLRVAVTDHSGIPEFYRLGIANQEPSAATAKPDQLAQRQLPSRHQN
jgi:hypothetical protein